MTNSTELPFTQDNLPVDEKMTNTEAERSENLTPAENIQSQIDKAETATINRVSQLVESVRGKVAPVVQEALSKIQASFQEKTKALRRDLEMKQIAKQRVEVMEEFRSEQAVLQLEQFFGYLNPEFSRAETTDLGQDIIQKFFEEHRHEPAEVRGGAKRQSENSRWIFYAQNSGGDKFSVEFFRKGDRFASIDIRKVISESGKELEYADESFHLIIEPNGKYKRGYITVGETQHLISAGEAEVSMAGYLQELQFDAEGTRFELQRFREIEVMEQRIEFARALGERLQVSAVGPEANTQIKVDLPDGEIAELVGDPQQSYLELLDELMLQNSKVAQAAGVIVTEF